MRTHSLAAEFDATSRGASRSRELASASAQWKFRNPPGITGTFSGQAEPLDRSLRRERGREDLRRERFQLRSKARHLYPAEVHRMTGTMVPGRFASCGYVSRSTGGAQVVWANTSGKREAWWSNVARCHSAWACPVCAAAAMAHRAQEVETVTDWHRARELRGQTAHVSMLTLTVRHKRGSDAELAELLAGVADAWRSVTRGSPWRRWEKRTLVDGYVRRVEATHSTVHGWHVHLHVLVYHRRWDDPRLQTSELDTDFVRQRWEGAVRKHLGDARVPSMERGVRWDDITSARPGAYLTKLGIEVASISDKLPKRGNRTPWMLLRSAAEENRGADVGRWRAWVDATKGHKLLTISPRLRRQAGLCEADNDDPEAAAATLALRVPRAAWAWSITEDDGSTTRGGLRRSPRALCALLDAVEDGAPEHVLRTMVEEFWAPDRPIVWPDEAEAHDTT